MINNEMRPVSVLTYNETTDAYGQKRQDTPTTRTVDMTVKIYSQQNVTDVRFTKVELIGLTKDTSITDKNVIQIDNVKYNVLYVIPSGRLTQVLMMRQ